MVFSRFFRKDTPADGGADDPDDETGTEPERDEGDESDGTTAPEEWEESTWGERAAKILPSATSTGSKRPAALYGEDDLGLGVPTHFLRASGCAVEASDGSSFIDCTMALGAVSLGYGEPRVTRAVLEAAGSGHVAGLPHVLEVEVAERFCELVPCAEKVQFLKTGADAVAAAVRIARTYTTRNVVVGCGYFGWHDWSARAAGVPAAVRAQFVEVPFDDVTALETAVANAGSDLAAVVLEPVIERLPSPAWITRARELCDAQGAVLIFDEIKTGFRVATGGYQDHANVKPDLAAFGKALANGYPLAAVCGREDLMDAARNTWISSTLAAESTALAAAYVVLDLYREEPVCERLAAIGRETKHVIDLAITSSGIGGVRVDGLDAMWMLRFASPRTESHFVQRAMRHGALFKRGAYNFPALAHDEESIMAVESAASTAFVEIVRAAESD
jgi:glutamate-1-semialdehyde 2,1-aminomutase